MKKQYNFLSKVDDFIKTKEGNIKIYLQGTVYLAIISIALSLCFMFFALYFYIKDYVFIKILFILLFLPYFIGLIYGDINK